MVIHVVTGQIGEDASREFQSADTLLVDGMARAFHKGILAAGLHHLAEQCIQFDRIWRGMVGRNSFPFNIVANGAQQSALITQFAEHII